MARVSYPGVSIQEIPSGVGTITGVATSVAAFIGRAERGPLKEPVAIQSFEDFERIFGGLWIESRLGHAVRDFYLNGGAQAIIVRVGENGAASATEHCEKAILGGLGILDRVDSFNLLCIPPEGSLDLTKLVLPTAARVCEDRRAMLIVDPPGGWRSREDAKRGIEGFAGLGRNAAIFFPWLRQPDPLRGNRIEETAPCGAVAGVIVRTDAQRGVWKAPAGLDATLRGVSSLSVPLTDADNGELDALGINCLRVLQGAGPVIWGARTLDGDDRRASEWKYIPVRRLALFVEESVDRGTRWVVFEPNDEQRWSKIRRDVGAFMYALWRQGAFQGATPREACFVKCDEETTTQNDIDQGIVNIDIGFAPLRPAEFVIVKIQQRRGQIDT